MAEESVLILRVDSQEAIGSVADIRENIRKLKEGWVDAQGVTHEAFEQLRIGSDEYRDRLDELKVNQNALKDAMHATTASITDVARAATGASDSYNSLVHRMAALKEEFRATEDAARRADLGGQIKAINEQLKDMDALQGNFQRNVGNYAGSIKSAFGDMSKEVDVFRKSLGAAKGGLNGLKDGMEGISKSPFIATLGILVSLALKLADELKENETAMAAVKKAMAALKPVTDFFDGILEKIAEWLADIIGKVTQFVTNNGLFQRIITGVMGVGNAILQYVIAPFKGLVAAIKVIKEEGVKGLGDAAKAYAAEIKNGFAFKQNFQAGKAVAETLISGAKSKKEEVKEAAKTLGKEAADGFLGGFDEQLARQIDKELEEAYAAIDKGIADANKAAVAKGEERLKALDKIYDHQRELNGILVEDERERAEKEYAIEREANERKLDLLRQLREEALDRADLDAYLAFDQQRADLEVEIETEAVREMMRLRKLDLKDAEAKAKAKSELLKGVASATSSILGSIADLYEADEANSEKNANKVKALRIASATVDTISGAIGAFMQASETIPPPYGQIVGAAAAAAVTASGIAQIAKLKSTKVSGTASQASVPVPAAIPAPSISTEVSNVRSVTSASEEDRLNRMAMDHRVYILASDIQASQNQIKTQTRESSF